MASLTAFLNEQPGMRAVPGYHGPNENHVLRVSGVPRDDTAFLALLREDFAQWQAQQPDADDRSRPDRVHVRQTVCCEPLHEADHFPHQSFLKRMVKENANTISGLSYMAGSVGLLLAAWRAPKRMPGHPPHDWFRSYTAASYFAASAILVAMSRKTDNPRDIYTIMENIYPPLTRMDRATRDEAQEQTGQIMRILKQYPWEISMLLNASGAGAHTLSSYKRGRHMEMAAALATLSACVVSAIIPEKGGRSMVPLGEWTQDGQGRNLLDRLEDFAEHHPNLSGWTNNVRHMYNWMQENPLKLAAGVQAVANMGYAATGFVQKNPALVGMSGAFFAGNYAQSQATKGRGDGEDSVYTAAADIIRADPSLKGVPPEVIEQRVTRLAERLHEQNEIVQPRRQLAQGIRARLRGEFLPREQRILAESPFVETSHVARAMPLSIPDVMRPHAAAMR